MRRHGYGIHFVDLHDGEFGIGEYIDRADIVATGDIHHEANRKNASLKVKIADRFLRGTCTETPTALDLLQSHNSSGGVHNGLIYIFPSQDPTTLMIRARLTAMLANEMAGTPKSYVEPSEADKLTALTKIKLYERLRKEGHRPFNVEELHGLASYVVEAALKSNPAIKPPANA